MIAKQLNSYIWDQDETLPRAEMEKLQLDRLRSCLQRLSHAVPFYRDKLADAGISPGDIKSLADLSQGEPAFASRLLSRGVFLCKAGNALFDFR